MESVFRYTIPVLHPLVVHFPFALTLTAALVALVWLFRGAAFWRRCMLLLLTFSMIGAVAAYLTGEEIHEQSEGVPIVDELAGLHEQMALYTLFTLGVALVSLAGVSFWLERRTTIERNPADPLAVRIIIGLVIFVAAVCVAWTAHIGATMVWGVAT